jgi:hypothetical protein
MRPKSYKAFACYKLSIAQAELEIAVGLQRDRNRAYRC